MKMKTCRICLVMDVKMVNLGNTDKKNFIERIFNLYGYNQKLNALHYTCFECRALLDNTFKFIQRVLKAQQVLQDMLKEKKKICQSDLRKLDRHKLGLNTNLKKHYCTVDFYVNEEAPDDKSLNNTNRICNYMSNSESGTEIKEDRNTKTYSRAVLNESKDIMLENKYFIEIKPEVIPDPLASPSLTDSGDESTTLNEQAINKSNTFNTLSCTVSRNENATKVNTFSYSNLVNLNNEKRDESSYNDTNSALTDEPIPNGEIMKKNSVEESECYVDIKIEEFPDPLASASASANLVSLESQFDVVTNESKVKNIISPDRYSCTIKPDAEINCDVVYNTDAENRNEDLSNMKRKLRNSSIKKFCDWRPGCKSKQSKRRRCLESQRSHVKKNPKLKTKSNKKKDDDYKPVKSSGDSENSMQDQYDNDGRRVSKPDERVYPRKCDHCNFEVPLKKEHYIHYLRYHKDVEYPYTPKTNFVCQFCGHISKRFCHHVTHELSHGEKTVKCTECPKKFTSRARMMMHSYYVHRGKTSECDYCGKTFKRRADLAIHIRIHTGEKPYKCHICGAGFAHGGNRNLHIRTNHQQSMEYKKNKKPRKRKYQYTSSDTDTISEDRCITTQKRKTVKAKKKNKKSPA